MNLGKATAIFKDINQSDRTTEEKKLAVRAVIGMETHNGITRQEAFNALGWLLNHSMERRMDGDLISRRAVIEELYKRVGGDLSIEDVRYIEKVIGSVPTAYDLNKVVERLEMEPERYKDPVSSDSSFRRFCEGISAGYRYAADIVKAGGVDE